MISRLIAFRFLCGSLRIFAFSAFNLNIYAENTEIR